MCNEENDVCTCTWREYARTDLIAGKTANLTEFARPYRPARPFYIESIRPEIPFRPFSWPSRADVIAVSRRRLNPPLHHAIFISSFRVKFLRNAIKHNS